MKTIIIICVFLVAVGTWITWELKRAPHGFQDEEGFHDSDENEIKADTKEKVTTPSD